MTEKLREYIMIEGILLNLEDAGHEDDNLRDKLDDIWLALTHEERATLDKRGNL